MPTFQQSYKKPPRSRHKGGPVAILQWIGLGGTAHVIPLCVFQQAQAGNWQVHYRLRENLLQ